MRLKEIYHSYSDSLSSTLMKDAHAFAKRKKFCGRKRLP